MSEKDFSLGNIVYPSRRTLRNSSRSASAPPYFRAVDGLRGLAILSVMLYHSTWSSRGLFGVDVFFVVSGFFITFFLLSGRTDNGRFALRRFYTRRAKRLLPGIVIVLVATLMLVWFLGTNDEYVSAAKTALFSLLQVANWQHIGSGVSYWNATGIITPFAHLWSLSVIAQFYLVWPFLLVIVFTIARRRLMVVGSIIAGLIVLSTLVTTTMFTGTNTERMYLGTDVRIVALLAGALAAVIVYARLSPKADLASRTGKVSSTSGGLVTALSVFALTVLVAASVMTSSYQNAWLYQGGLTIVACAAAVFTATLCFSRNSLVTVFGWKPLVWLGKISFTVFLVHLPVYWVLQTMNESLPPLALFLVGGSVSCGVAWALHVVATEPLRRARWRISSTITAVAASTAVIAVAAIWVPGVTFPERLGASSAEPVAHAESNQGAAGGETRSRNTITPVVLTVGDSTAKDFATMLGAHGSGVFAARDRGYGGCGIFDPDRVQTSTGFRLDSKEQGCHDWPSQLEKALLSERPDIVLVHTAWDATDQYLGGRLVDTCSPAWRERFVSKLDLLWTIVDRAPSVPRLVVARSRPWSSAVTSAERMACFNEAVVTWGEGSGGAVSVIDWGSAVCPGGVCRRADDQGRSLFVGDDIHLSDAGMRFFAPWLENQLAAATRTVS